MEVPREFFLASLLQVLSRELVWPLLDFYKWVGLVAWKWLDKRNLSLCFLQSGAWVFWVAMRTGFYIVVRTFHLGYFIIHYVLKREDPRPFYWDRKNKENLTYRASRVGCPVAWLTFFSSLIQMNSPHFKLFASKIPDPQVPSVVTLQVLKLCLCWALIILVVSVFGLISLRSTGFQLPFWFPNLSVTVSKILITFSWRQLTKLQCLRREFITQYDHGIQDQSLETHYKAVYLELRIPICNTGPAISSQIILNSFQIVVGFRW